MKTKISRPTPYHYDLYFFDRDSICMHYKYWTSHKEPLEFYTVEEEVKEKPFCEKHGKVKCQKRMKRLENRLLNAVDFPKEKKTAEVNAVLNTPTAKKLSSSLTKNQRKRLRKKLAKATKNKNW